MPTYIYVCDEDDNLYKGARALTHDAVVDLISFKSTKEALGLLCGSIPGIGGDEIERRRNNIQSIIELAKKYPNGFFTIDRYEDWGWTV